MLEALPEMVDFFMSLMQQYWGVITGCSLLAAFLALAVLDRIFHIFDVIRR